MILKAAEAALSAPKGAKVAGSPASQAKPFETSCLCEVFAVPRFLRSWSSTRAWITPAAWPASSVAWASAPLDSPKAVRWARRSSLAEVCRCLCRSLRAQGLPKSISAKQGMMKMSGGCGRSALRNGQLAALRIVRSLALPTYLHDLSKLLLKLHSELTRQFVQLRLKPRRAVCVVL